MSWQVHFCPRLPVFGELSSCTLTGVHLVVQRKDVGASRSSFQRTVDGSVTKR